MECCQQELAIIGVTLIEIFICILGFYVSVYFDGFTCAWKEGALLADGTPPTLGHPHTKRSLLCNLKIELLRPVSID